MSSINVKIGWVHLKFSPHGAGPFSPMSAHHFRTLRVVRSKHYTKRQIERDAANALKRNLTGGSHPLFGLPICAPIGSAPECKYVIAFHDVCVIVAPLDTGAVVAVTTLPAKKTHIASFNAYIKLHAPAEWAHHKKQTNRGRPVLEGGRGWATWNFTYKRKPSRKATLCGNETFL